MNLTLSAIKNAMKDWQAHTSKLLFYPTNILIFVRGKNNS
jgi:hypothetical protein